MKQKKSSNTEWDYFCDLIFKASPEDNKNNKMFSLNWGFREIGGTTLLKILTSLHGPFVWPSIILS